MKASKSAIALAYVVSLAAMGMADTSPEDFLAAHNAVRSDFGVGPLTWDPKLEAYASEYAKGQEADCELVHSGGPYGENLYVGYGQMYVGAGRAVKSWVGEKQYYTYETNSCEEGMDCRHYKQVVWRNTQRLGCAGSICYNGNTFIICNYDPPGNIDGETPY
ncbi:hypothetical protein ACLOJK_036090 [Asimina triloba]